MSPGARSCIMDASADIRGALALLELAAERLSRAAQVYRMPEEIPDVQLDLTGCIGTLRHDERQLADLVSATHQPA